MVKETARRKTAPRHLKATTHGKNGIEMFESYLPTGSTERAVAGIAAAMAGVLLAAAVLGVGPTALAGAAGYVVYHETHQA